MSDSVGVELEAIRERARTHLNLTGHIDDRRFLLALLDEAVELLTGVLVALDENWEMPAIRAFLHRLGRDQSTT